MTKFNYKPRRAGTVLVLLNYELRAADEFYKHTAQSFKRRIREIGKAYEKYSDEELDRDLGGTTMGELAGEQILESKMLSEMNGYLGILNVFGALERFLLLVFKDMQHRGEVTGEAAAKEFLQLEGYKDVLRKDLGIYLSQPLSKWNELKKLQALRNIIAHHNGNVTGDQVRKVSSYGYKLGDDIVIDEKYFYHAIDLVRESCSLLSRKLNSLSTPKPKTKKRRRQKNN